jgi:hypothetical protein
MAADILGKCPVCTKDTEVVKIRCEHCGTTIEGRFAPCKFCRLTAEQKSFIDIFVKCRGNIKEMEKELGVSYPTVKNRLEDAAAALGYKAEQTEVNPEKKKTVLDRLNNGEITVDEALNLLKE